MMKNSTFLAIINFQEKMFMGNISDGFVKDKALP